MPAVPMDTDSDHIVQPQYRLRHHKRFNNSQAKYDEWWTLQKRRRFLWHWYWKTECYYTEAGPIEERFYDRKKVVKLAEHYGIEMPA